ncbi:MAG TPA: HAD-IA family hydrolase [Thermoanaerobaculia bacterium]|nr:HAD-IA family hydrolase [Thermoanaerobaculia bacterium]
MDVRRRTILWDVGGVLLSNGWDHLARGRAVRTFDLEGDDFEARHQRVVEAFECGRIGLNDYLDRTVFWKERRFSRGDFRDFMLSQSEAQPAALDLASRVARLGRARMVTANNESLELNRYRISSFGLDEIFESFFSSCYLGVRKPDSRFFSAVGGILGKDLEGCVFIDDREENVSAARSAGLETIHFSGTRQLERELRALGVTEDAKGSEEEG